MTPRRRWITIAAVALAASLVAGSLALHLAARHMKHAVAQALGPRASIGELRVGWGHVEVTDVRIAAATGAGGWPAADELRARRVRITPSLRSLLGDAWHVDEIAVEQAYVSALRTRDGRLRIVPALLETRPSGPSKPHPLVTIGSVRFADITFDFHDASIRRPAHRVQIVRLEGEVANLVLPALDQPVALDVSGVVKGVRHDGRLSLQGRVTPAARDARIDARLKGVDLLALQPYLLRVSEGGVRSGRLDLRLDAAVARGRIEAPGTLVLDGLALDAGSGLSRFAGVPRQAVVAAMQRDGRIELKFKLEGRLDDPSFSLNESFATRLSSSLAESVGVSVGGVVEGVGNVVKGLFGR